MEAFESSITFHHILSQPFSNNDKYGNFLKVLLFPSGSFHSMGIKQGLIVSRGNIPKDSVCVYLFCVATLWCDPVLHMMSAQSRLVTHLCVKLIPNLEGVVRSCDLACAPDAELALPILQHLSLSPRLSGSLFDFLYTDDFQISYVAFHSWYF